MKRITSIALAALAVVGFIALPTAASASVPTRTVLVYGNISCHQPWYQAYHMDSVWVWTPQTGNLLVSTGAGSYAFYARNVPQSGTYMNYTIRCHNVINSVASSGQSHIGWPAPFTNWRADL
jgi:hypothetical protein